MLKNPYRRFVYWPAMIPFTVLFLVLLIAITILVAPLFLINLKAGQRAERWANALLNRIEKIRWNFRDWAYAWDWRKHRWT